MKIPKVKKKVSAFIRSEEGRISKQSLMAVGAFLGGAALAGVLAAKEVAAGHVDSWKHNSAVQAEKEVDIVVGSHKSSKLHSNYHVNHSNHASY